MDKAMSKRRGIFLSIEGIDGCGKSTQLELCCNYLQDRGIKLKLLREPGATRVGEQIRNILLNPDFRELTDRCELLLYEAARAQLCEELIEPLLEEGYWVICDRFFDSTVAYQGSGRKLKFDDINVLNYFACQGLKPDITFVLDIDVQLSLDRALAYSKPDRLELEGIDFMQRVAAAYTQLIVDEPQRVKRIDASKTPQEVFRQIIPYLDTLMGEGF